MDVRKYITEESIKKIQESINNESYYCNDAMEKQIVDEIVNILRDDEKFQEFSKQMMQKIILEDLFLHPIQIINYLQSKGHKATVEEIIEHFKDK